MTKLQLLTRIKDANWFIIEIAKMLNIDTDGISYDECQLTLDDFQEAIKNLPNEPKTVRDNEQEKEVCCPDCQVPMTRTNTDNYICEDESCTQTD